MNIHIWVGALIGIIVALTVMPFVLYGLFSYWTWIFDFLERKKK